MLIGIDGNEANVEKRVGVSEYAFELLRQFSIFNPSTSSGQVFQFSMKTENINFRIYLKSKPLSDLPKQSDRWNYRIVRPRKLWTQIGLPFDLYFHKPRPDVFFTPSHYAPRFSPIPTVVSIMDLSYIHFPELFKKSDLYQLMNWTQYSVRKAKKILTISQASKSDIIRVYQVPKEKVVVTYPGIKKFSIFNFQFSMKSQFSNFQKIKDKYGINGEYILFVGTIQPRKNIVRLVEAFSKIRMHTNNYFESTRIKKDSDKSGEKIRKNSDLQLAIVGKKGWLYEEILGAPKKFGVEDRVKFLDFVPDEDLTLFYKHALFFILPSLYEGFGLPVLEAMKWGCPVITSKVSSLPEAGGDAAIYVDPENIDDIVSKMELLMKDQEKRKDMIEKGYKQVKKFSWDKTARETLKALEEVAIT